MPPGVTLVAQLTVDGLLLGGVFALSALGLNVIFGVTRVVNLAHGEIVVWAALCSAVVFTRFSINPLLLLPLAIPAGFAFGVACERLLLRRLPPDLASSEAASLLITFGLSYFLVGAGLAAFTGDFRSVSFITGSWQLGPLAIAQARFIAFLAAALIGGVLALVLRHTAAGRALRATSQDVDGALACGIDVTAVRTMSFGLGTAIAAASGCLLSLIYAVNPNLGSDFTLTAFSVVALGGLGSYVGTLVGAGILGLAVAYSGYVGDAHAAEAAPYVIFILVLLFRPAGLLGRPA